MQVPAKRIQAVLPVKGTASLRADVPDGSLASDVDLGANSPYFEKSSSVQLLGIHGVITSYLCERKLRKANV